jgi:CRP-like cAMP-binding protein
MRVWHDILITRLRKHSKLDGADIAHLRRLIVTVRAVAANEDIVRQGDKPNVSVVVLEGVVARYHMLRGGGRQYLSLHIAGDLPDLQALFLDEMDHALCAMNDAIIAQMPHRALFGLFDERPKIMSAFWRETLIDASIFRQAITNNSARPPATRLAHFLCEQYYRARLVGLVSSGSCSLPLTQTELGEAIGVSLPSISRAMPALQGVAEVRGGRLHVHDWEQLVELGDFDPKYLHVSKSPR